MTPIAIAIIGAGHLGKIHTRLLKGLQQFNIVAVVDPVPEARAAIEEQFQLPTLDDYRLLEGKVDAVVIATPTSLHLEASLWCLEHGMHCLVEKPLVRSARQAALLVQVAERRQRILQVGHVERFNPAWQAIRPLLRHTIHCEAHRTSTYTGRSTDIGVVLDLMIHDLDLILDAVDSSITHIGANGQAILGEHEDWAEAHLQFENGATASLYASRVSRTPQRRLHILADDMSAELDFATGTLDIVEASDSVRDRTLRADQLPALERSQIQKELFTRWLPHRTVKTESINAIEHELLDFHRAISQSSQPVVDGQSARRTIDVAERIVAAIQAASQQRRLAREAEQQLDIIPAAHRFGKVRRAS